MLIGFILSRMGEIMAEDMISHLKYIEYDGVDIFIVFQ